jgi:hypothetical protein
MGGMNRRQALALMRKHWPYNRVWVESRSGGFCDWRVGTTRCRCLTKDCSNPGARLYMVGTETWCRCVMGVGHTWEEAVAKAGVKEGEKVCRT